MKFCWLHAFTTTNFFSTTNLLLNNQGCGSGFVFIFTPEARSGSAFRKTAGSGSAKNEQGSTPHLVLCFCLNVATRDFELARKYGFLFTVPVFTESYGFLRVHMNLLDFFYESFLYKPKVGSESAFLIHITDWKQNNSDPHS